MMLTCPALSGLPGLRHGFFTRRGGVSAGIYASLNCAYGTGDQPVHVRENMRLVTQALGLADGHYCKAHQVHGAVASIAEAPWPPGEAPQADAIVTGVTGLAVGVTTADCAPILLADGAARVVAAAHAGWKGALGGIAEATVAAMERLGAARSRIVATIGPCIAQESYEVGPEFRARLVDESAQNSRFFMSSQKPAHFRFDLRGYAAHRLEESGIAIINSLARDTCSEENAFFSYRRAMLKGESQYGCQFSAIVLE